MVPDDEGVFFLDGSPCDRRAINLLVLKVEVAVCYPSKRIDTRAIGLWRNALFMNRLTGNAIRRFVPLIKVLVMLAVIVGLALAVRSAMTQWDEQAEMVQQQLAALDHEIGKTSGIQRAELSAKRAAIDATVPRLSNLSWRGLSLSMLLYGCGLIPSAFVLRSALMTMGDNPRMSTCVASQLLGHVGKYVPGKAMVIVLRAGALDSRRCAAADRDDFRFHGDLLDDGRWRRVVRRDHLLASCTCMDDVDSGVGGDHRQHPDLPRRLAANCSESFFEPGRGGSIEPSGCGWQ